MPKVTKVRKEEAFLGNGVSSQGVGEGIYLSVSPKGWVLI